MSYFSTSLARVIDSHKSLNQNAIAEAAKISKAQISRILSPCDSRTISKEALGLLLKCETLTKSDRVSLLTAYLLDETPESFALEVKSVLSSWADLEGAGEPAVRHGQDAKLDQAIEHLKYRALSNPSLTKLLIELEQVTC